MPKKGYLMDSAFLYFDVDYIIIKPLLPTTKLVSKKKDLLNIQHANRKDISQEFAEPNIK